MATDTVQAVKDKLTITEVVAPYIKLVKAGRYMKGLSPFTKEKTPSFFVNPERGSYYCFSTTQGGDMFTFIEKMEGVDFKGALKILAEKAGVPLVYEKGEGSGNNDARERLREAMSRAEAFYVSQFVVGSEAHTYALGRGLTPESLSTWRIGFAPSGWRTLLEHLTEQGFTTDELIRAGLIKEADEKKGTYYDRFRNRLMFPIKDTAGRTVAFTGRAMDPTDQAKYLNSPETDLYKKSEILFGMHLAKDAIRTRGFALLVEGQFDLTLAHQSGFENTIALSGTALSEKHIALIKRYADNLMLALDADRAGLAASAKNATAALADGMKVKAVKLPQGKDPADCISEDPKEFVKMVKDADSIIEFFLSVLATETSSSHDLVLRVEETVLPLVRVIPSPLEREHFIGIVARGLGMSVDAVRQTMKRVALPENRNQEVHVRVDTVMQETKVRRTPREIREESLLALRENHQGTDLAKLIENEYSRITGVAASDTSISERALIEAELSYGESPTEEDIQDLIRSFERAVLEQELR
ncbi:MAG: DNA primase, partial [Candidatus Pacebacteria bacterium]|nr:DNA primase [Candidatus Paceibacterota bacterium]